MKLSQMKYNNIRCLVYMQDGKVLRSYKQEEINRLLLGGILSQNAVIVHQPNKEQRKSLLTLLEDNRQDNEINVGGMQLLKLMEMLTNLDLGIESGELTQEEALEIIANPNEMLEAVNQELNSVLMNLLRNQFAIAQEMSQLPEAVKTPLLEKVIEQANKEEEERARLQAEREAEELRIKELELELLKLKSKSV